MIIIITETYMSVNLFDYGQYIIIFFNICSHRQIVEVDPCLILSTGKQPPIPTCNSKSNSKVLSGLSRGKQGQLDYVSQSNERSKKKKFDFRSIDNVSHSTDIVSHSTNSDSHSTDSVFHSIDSVSYSTDGVSLSNEKSKEKNCKFDSRSIDSVPH